MHTKQQVFHYWLTFKNSAQYLKMMEAQLLERQRARRLQAATQLWRANTAQSRLKQQAEAVPATPITAAATSEAADAKRTHQTISPPSQRRRSTGAASGLARRGAASYHHRTRVLPDSPESSFLQAGASVAMQSGTYRQLVTVLMYWKRFTRHHSWRRLRLQASLRFSMWIRMHACFKCIRAYAENRSFSRRARTRVIARMRMHHTAAAFTSWGSMVTQRRQVRSFHLECARRIYNRALHRVSAGAFETWLLYMEWESRAAKIVVGRFQGQQRRCFMAWADDSRQQKLMRNALTLVVFHRAQRLLTLTFNALAHTCRRRARVRRLQRKGLLRMQHMLLARCCNSWSEHTLERSRFRLTLLRTILASWRKLAEGDLVFKAKLRSSIWRWKFYNKLSTFRRWRTFTMHVVHVQLHALALLGKLGKRTLHNCFHSWYGTLAARAIKNSKVLVVVRLMQDNSVLAVFNSWHGALLAAIRRQQLFCRCMATMQHRSLVSALRRWQELVVERTRMLNLLRGAVFQLQKGRLCSALALWHFCVKERIRLRYAGTKVVLRLGQRALASAFDSWLDHMLNRLRATASVGRVIVRMQQLVLSSALDSWIAWTEHRSHEKDLMAKAVNRTLHITSARSFSTWAEWTTDRIRGRRLLEHAIRRMCRVRLNHAMLGWADRVVRGHEARDQLLVVLVKMQKNSEARAFRTWLKCHSEVQHVMQRGSVALRKMMLHRSHRAFQSVRQHADDSMRRTRLLTKVVRRVGSLQLARVLDAWVGFTNERRFLMSVALKLQNGILARAFVRFLGVCLRQLQVSSTTDCLIASIRCLHVAMWRVADPRRFNDACCR
jgi:hypothetical protein